MLSYWLLLIKTYTKKLLEMDEIGQTLVEYALIIAFVAILLIGALNFLGVNLGDYYESFANAIPN